MPSSDLLARATKGPHHALIKQKIPHWLSTASLARAVQLHGIQPSRAPWYRTATPEQHNALRTTNADSWRTQNSVDRQLSNVQDVYAFAEPLLKKAIRDTYQLELNVRTTFLYLYMPKELPWYVVNIHSATLTRTVSLLDAALHNFAQSETFDDDSVYISQPDARGHFTVLPLTPAMSLNQFKSLCRELDLGARYQQHVRTHLLPVSPSAGTALKTQVIASQKAALKAAAHLALLKTDTRNVPDLGAAAHHTVMRALQGERGVMQFYRLSIMDVPLTGILIIAADLERMSSVSKVIVYIPHDPESPVKEYGSTVEFMRDLTRKLQTNAPMPSRPQQTYQQFFSQFVDHDKRGHFFAGLNQRLYKVQWHTTEALDARPPWREDPLSHPNLYFYGHRIKGDLWEQRYQSALNKILNDGRNLAISTADADSRYRWAWWDNFTKILGDIFNAALMVIAPFVPVLGEGMMAYTVFQLTYDVIEGLDDLAEGLFIEAAEHLVSVTLDVVELASFALGGNIIAGGFKRSPFVDGLRAVQVGDQQRLWHPDLAPYAHDNLQLPREARPDELGLYAHQNQKVLRLGTQHYVVEHDDAANTYRVKHPSRPEAYSPTLDHNGNGAWLHEGENPGTWDGETLRSRLGPMVDGLDPAQLEQACDTSGTHDNALRMMYLNRDTPPPLLTDSLQRMKLLGELDEAPQRIRSGTQAELPANWLVQITSELPGWPSDKAIKVYMNDDLSGAAMTYGAAEASEANTLKISYQDAQGSRLTDQLSGFLSPLELATLLPPDAVGTSADPVQALRRHLADRLAQEKITVFNHLYSTAEVLGTPNGRLIHQHFPRLPKNLVTELLLRASTQELSVMGTEQRIPLRLKNLARELTLEVRASHATEGLYDDALLTPDTERMALNILRQRTDALGDLNIAIHEQNPSGSLRCQVGPSTAATQKILLYKGQGRYQLHASTSESPHSSFYEALLHAVPPGKLEHVPGQGRIFQAWLREQLQPPTERRTVLEAPTRRQADRRATQALLQRPMFSALRRLFQAETPGQPPTTEETLAKLCPHLTQEQVENVLPHLNTQQGHALLNTLDADYKTLHKELEKFRTKPQTFSSSSPLLREGETFIRSQIISTLKNCWAQGAYLRMLPPEPQLRGTLLDLSGVILGRYIRQLPPLRADFSHVTRLNLRDTTLSNSDTNFLNNFANVRAINLADNQLTSLPSPLPQLKNLRSLNLSENPIAWEPADHTTLNQCSQLYALNLEGNLNLKVPPDLHNLPNLRTLVLRRTRITQWPDGLNTPRPTRLVLDMTATQVRTVPEFPQGSAGAEAIGNAWLDRTQLSLADEDRMIGYRRALGLDPYRTIPPRGQLDSQYWTAGMTDTERTEVQKIWNDLEAEHGSQGFFRVIKMLERPEGFQTEIDEQLFQQGQQDLTRRVLQVLYAADENPDFRDRMFSLAAMPDNCVDAAANTFNSMGVETLLEDILKDHTPQGLASRESRLVTLARQVWRLKKVNEFARQDIQRRTAPTHEGGLGQEYGSGPNQVDGVEIQLAYQTGLKRQLDLPWLSEHMAYRTTAGVTQTDLDNAVRIITELEKGDGLVNGVLEQPFWDDYLQDAHLDAFKVQREQRAQAISQMIDLHSAHEEWASASVTPEREAQLREQIVTLANELVIPHSVVLSKEPLSDTTLKRLYDDIADHYQQLERQLTRQALRAANP